MPIWSGATYNDIKRVKNEYLILRVRVANGLKLDRWKHHYVDTTERDHLLTYDHWKTANFTMFVYCPFDTTLGGAKDVLSYLML